MIPAYEINDLVFQYNGKDIINIDYFEIPRNKSIALFGPNGAGKSTFIDLLSFLLHPVTGTIKFFGEISGKDKHNKFRSRIGYVQQHPYLFNMSVIENIELGMKLRGLDKQSRRYRVNNIIEQLDLYNIANRRAHALSGGEIQKVALARALVIDPDILLLDEPFAHLDKTFIQEFEKLLLIIRETQQKTIIFTSHDQIRAQLLADLVYHMTNGVLVEELSLNIFCGQYSKEENMFDTGKINIKLPDTFEHVNKIAIEPTQVVISRNRLDSSMRNCFQGNISAVKVYGENFEILVNAGENFRVVITQGAMDELGLVAGDSVWISFKSTAITALP
jgi:molybdopterin-binding protein